MIRLFLTERQQLNLPLINGAPISDSRPMLLTRQEYIRDIFGRERRFPYRDQVYCYTPFESDGNILTGVVARERTVKIGMPPEAHYQTAMVPDWDTSNVFVDISGDIDGQKIAMQESPVVGQPLAILRSFMDSINRDNLLQKWTIIVNNITSDDDFWSAVSKYKGRIAEIDMVFAAPNIWGGQTETEKALRELNKINGMTETEVKIKNPEGKIDPGSADDGGAIAESVNYIRRGGGSIKMKSTRRRPIYNSDNHVVKKSPNEDYAVQAAERSVVLALAKWLLDR